MSSDNILPNSDDFESISSTNLTIKSTLTGSNNQPTSKSITKTISPSHTKQQLNMLQSKEPERRERSKSATGSRHQESVTTHLHKGASFGNKERSDQNELKHVFAKLQSKSTAQKLRQHLQEEEAEEAKPAKENRGKDDNSLGENLLQEQT